jgi:GxxExxY protein
VLTEQAHEESRDPHTYSIIGAAMEVHRELGPEFLESVYQEALAIEFDARGIPFTRETPIEVRYKGKILTSPFRADFVCFGEVIVELKAVEKLNDVHSAQVLHYLKATGYQKAILVNFKGVSLDFRRFVN